MKMKKYGLAKYSAENLERIKKVLKIVSDDLELQGINRLAGNKISLKRFEDQSFFYTEVIEILKVIGRKVGMYTILNLEIADTHRYAIPPYIYDSNTTKVEEKNNKEILKTLHLTEDDIKNNIVLKANSLGLVDKLKEVLHAIDNIQQKSVGSPENWEWSNRNKGEYQFGKIPFTQGGKIRKKVFVALMDIYKKTPQAIVVQTVAGMAEVSPARLRVEIAAINKGIEEKIGYYFKGSGKGYYTLEKYTPRDSS